MKKVKVEMFEAEDGTRWETEDACKRHEMDSVPLAVILHRWVGAGGVAIVEAAMRYDADVVLARELGDTIERAARKCSEARIAAGGAKRKRKDKTNAAPPLGETKPEERNVDTTKIIGPVEGPSVSFAPAGVPPKPVDWTGVRALTERGLPTKDNPFPAHGPREEIRQA